MQTHLSPGRWKDHRQMVSRPAENNSLGPLFCIIAAVYIVYYTLIFFWGLPGYQQKSELNVVVNHLSQIWKILAVLRTSQIFVCNFVILLSALSNKCTAKLFASSISDDLIIIKHNVIHFENTYSLFAVFIKRLEGISFFFTMIRLFRTQLP